MAERDWTAIYRRVKSKPIFMKDGRPSSALFKDSKGVSVEVCVVPDPISGENEYHALLQKSESEIQLSKSQAKTLARLATVIKNYA